MASEALSAKVVAVPAKFPRRAPEAPCGNQRIFNTSSHLCGSLCTGLTTIDRILRQEPWRMTEMEAFVRFVRFLL